MKTVLGVGAHPDDLEIFCGGTLARYSQQGWKVVIVSVCSGDKGGEPERNVGTAEIRREEAKRSAKVIGAQSVILGFPDSEITVGMKLRNAVVDLIRRVRPDVVITHLPGDYHSDHKVVAEEVTDSTYISSSMGFKTAHKPVNLIPVVYYMDTLAGIGFVPTEYVDITGTMDKKLQMLKEHKSQFINLEKRGGLDMIEIVKDTAKFRGWQSGVRYAEGFQVCPRWPNLKTGRVLP